jgi:hypothetical protein
MKKYALLLSLLVLLCFRTQAQEIPAAAPAKKYMGMIEIGYLLQQNQNNQPNTSDASPTLVIFNGYRFHRMLSVGPTIGLDFYNAVLIAPVALGLRGSLLATRVSPTYTLDAGYGTTFLHDNPDQSKASGGWMVNPALGLRVNTGNETAFTFNLGYKLQHASTQTTLWNGSMINNEYSFKRLSVRMGFLF